MDAEGSVAKREQGVRKRSAIDVDAYVETTKVELVGGRLFVRAGSGLFTAEQDKCALLGNFNQHKGGKPSAVRDNHGKHGNL